MLKNYATGFAVCVAAFAAAEKRDYAEISSFRQPFQQSFFAAAGAPTSLRQPSG
ncbi:hypothetical protein [Cupriavidus sp. TMH.W2]|uniref:hypothetical protein n=1 Tax=Cupriavidus sp. TMH.W2 TaxID=3434465 RepID=UPI003D77EE93